jgi:ketosteroid isomerase-like protein
MTASANLDLLRSIFARWERGDYSSLEWAQPEIEWVWVDGPVPGTWTGLAGVAEAWREFLAAWDDHRIVAENYRELDDERVLVLTRRTGRGKTSGLELDQLVGQGAAVFHISQAKITKIVAYWDRDRALADLGLTE